MNGLRLVHTQAWLRLIATAGAVLLVIGAVVERERFFESYLVAVLFCLGLSLGPLVLAMIAQITGGRWGLVIAAPALAAAGVLPLLAILFVPLLFGLDQLYPWLSGVGASEKLLAHKEPYLNLPFFLARALLYFGVWIAVSWRFRARLLAALEHDTPTNWKRVRRVSAVGLLLYAATGTLAAMDWIMSLLPAWYSTVFGAQVLAMQVLAATAVLALGTARWPAQNPVVTTQDYHDLGNLMFVFTLLWAYLAYSEFVTIWIADLPHETEWYRQREMPLWEVLGATVWLLQFGLPFIALLFRAVKRSAGTLSLVASSVLLGSLLNCYWLVLPSLRTRDDLTSWMDWVAPVAVGAAWLALFLGRRERIERGYGKPIGARLHVRI